MVLAVVQDTRGKSDMWDMAEVVENKSDKQDMVRVQVLVQVLEDQEWELVCLDWVFSGAEAYIVLVSCGLVAVLLVANDDDDESQKITLKFEFSTIIPPTGHIPEGADLVVIDIIFLFNFNFLQ